jgi:MYXO-CTERM domain-containing protein
VVLHFDGRAWHQVDGVTFSTATSVFAFADRIFVSTWGPGDVHATDRIPDGAESPDGGRTWTTTEFPLTSAYKLFGFSTDDVWLGTQTNFGAGPLYHFDGRRWAQVPVSGFDGIHSMWGASSDDLWIAQGRLLHKDASAVTPVAENLGKIRAVSGTAATDVWAVGEAGAVAHYDGKSWSSIAPFTAENLWTVWAAAKDDVWASGDRFDVVFHWDGSTWSSATTMDAPRRVSVFTGTGPTDGWAIGTPSFVPSGTDDERLYHLEVDRDETAAPDASCEPLPDAAATDAQHAEPVGQAQDGSSGSRDGALPSTEPPKTPSVAATPSPSAAPPASTPSNDKMEEAGCAVRSPGNERGGGLPIALFILLGSFLLRTRRR